MSHSAPDAHLIFLRRLVTILTATMIGGIVLICTLLVIRLNTAPPPLSVPPGLVIPDHASPSTLSFTASHILIVDQHSVLHIFDRSNGALLKSMPLQ